jgi:hypothetical protein
VITHHTYYRGCKTKYCWRSVDAHFQDVVWRVSILVWHIKEANTSKMNRNVPMSIFCDTQLLIPLQPEMWNPKRRNGDWNRRVQPNSVKHAGWRVRDRVWPTKSLQIGFLDGFGTEPTRYCGPNPDRWWVIQTDCKHYSHFSLLYDWIEIVGSWIEAELCSVHDSNGDRRDSSWYLQKPNISYVRLEG